MIPDDVKRVLQELKSFCSVHWCVECQFWKENGCTISINRKNPEDWKGDWIEKEAPK